MKHGRPYCFTANFFEYSVHVQSAGAAYPDQSLCINRRRKHDELAAFKDGKRYFSDPDGQDPGHNESGTLQARESLVLEGIRTGSIGTQ